MLDKWKSAPVFVDFSTIALYFPSEMVSNLIIPTSDRQINVKKWIQLISDSGINIIVMKISSFSINCLLQRDKVETYFNTFPIRFPDSIWSYGNFFNLKHEIYA